MAPVDLTELQNIAGKYAGQHNVILAAGPFTAMALVRQFITKNKLVSMAMVASGGWLTIQALSGSSLKLMHEQFGYLINLLGSFRG